MPRGDFIADAKRDSTYPRDAATLGELDNYLFLRRACDEARACAKALWHEYRRWQRQ